MFTLNKKVKLNLRNILRKSYGGDFESSLSDEEVKEIGDLLLTVFEESLKMKIKRSSLLKSNSKSYEINKK